MFFTYPHLQNAAPVVLFNSLRPTEWDKVMHYLSTKENHITNKKVCGVTGNPDTAKALRILRRWADQGLLVKIGLSSLAISRGYTYQWIRINKTICFVIIHVLPGAEF